MPKTLFPGDQKDTDHQWFKTMSDGASSYAKELREFSNRTYERYSDFFDSHFPTAFRQDTPQRFSELYFAAAFMNVGFQPVESVTHFDFAFTRSDFPGRVLVEVTTPKGPAASTWTEELGIGGQIITSMDSETRDATLLRLTHSLRDKSKIMKKAIDEGHTHPADYRILAISGVRISQEGGWTLYGMGDLPEFASAFLPIGSLQIPITFSADPVPRPIAGPMQRAYSPEIEKGSTSVDRDAFLSGKFPHVDAVAFTPLMLGGVLSDPEPQIGVLHNPTSQWFGERPSLGLGADYLVDITENNLP